MSEHGGPLIPEKPATKPKEATVEPFWLNAVFPDAVKALEFESPTIDELLDSCVFAFDTNALLAPLDLSGKSIDSIEKIYRALAESKRLFAPAHAVREFTANRSKKIVKAFEEIELRITGFPSFSEVESPMLNGIPLLAEVNACFSKMKEIKKEAVKKLLAMKELLSDWGWKDRVSVLYREVFTAANILECQVAAEELRKLHQDRFSKSLPPGYKDGSKQDGGVGDLIIWLTLIDLSKTEKKPLIFVTNESKPDWYYNFNKHPVLPREELRHEFFDKSGFHIGLINWVSFLEKMQAGKEVVTEAASVADLAKGDTYRPEAGDLRKRCLSVVNDLIGTFDIVGAVSINQVKRSVYEFTQMSSELYQMLSFCHASERPFLSILRQRIKNARKLLEIAMSESESDILPLNQQALDQLSAIRGFVTTA